MANGQAYFPGANKYFHGVCPQIRTKSVRLSYKKVIQGDFVGFFTCEWLFRCVEATSVLNGVAWSATLDEAFRKNFEDDSSLSWQYFASQSGFLRNFPGTECYTFRI